MENVIFSSWWYSAPAKTEETPKGTFFKIETLCANVATYGLF